MLLFGMKLWLRGVLGMKALLKLRGVLVIGCLCDDKQEYVDGRGGIESSYIHREDMTRRR